MLRLARLRLRLTATPAIPLALGAVTVGCLWSGGPLADGPAAFPWNAWLRLGLAAAAVLAGTGLWTMLERVSPNDPLRGHTAPSSTPWIALLTGAIAVAWAITALAFDAPYAAVLLAILTAARTLGPSLTARMPLAGSVMAGAALGGWTLIGAWPMDNSPGAAPSVIIVWPVALLALYHGTASTLFNWPKLRHRVRLAATLVIGLGVLLAGNLAALHLLPVVEDGEMAGAFTPYAVRVVVALLLVGLFLRYSLPRLKPDRTRLYLLGRELVAAGILLEAGFAARAHLGAGLVLAGVGLTALGAQWLTRR